MKHRKEKVLHQGNIHNPGVRKPLFNSYTGASMLFLIALLIPAIGSLAVNSALTFNDTAQSIFLPNRFPPLWSFLVSWGILAFSFVAITVSRIRQKTAMRRSYLAFVASCAAAFALTFTMFNIIESLKTDNALTVFALMDTVRFDGEYIISDDNKIAVEIINEAGGLILSIPNTEGYELIKAKELDEDSNATKNEIEYNYFE